MHIATSPDTVMILNQEGQLTTRGPSRTEIRQEPSPSPGRSRRIGVGITIAQRIGISITVAISETMTSGTLPATSPDLSKESGIGTEEVLITEQLVKIYGGRAVVNGVNLNVRANEIVGLLGPNGAGKTTSFYMIVGLVRPNSGRVVFSGTDVTKFPMYKRARLGMGYLPQEESIFRKMSVEQNILAILRDTAVEQGGKTESLRTVAASVRHRTNREKSGAHFKRWRKAAPHYCALARDASRSCSCSTNRLAALIRSRSTMCSRSL